MSTRRTAQIVVVGAGVIGLAVARALAQTGEDVLILEANSGFGKETSSRSSEVIHSGLYYANDSLKARTCVRGRELLYEYAARCAVRVRRTGKLIAACCDAELHALEELHAHAQGNGVQDLRPLSRQEIADLEPALRVQGALFSPSTGIVDSHALMRALLADAEAHGARTAFGA
jgi:L-2-hydroxyglutarate oxidase LhgO